jgi:hypothetical protein
MKDDANVNGTSMGFKNRTALVDTAHRLPFVDVTKSSILLHEHS